MTVGATQRAAATARVIDNLREIEEIRSAWNAWRGHRDADVDVYETVLASRMDAAKPHIIVVEHDGRPDALMVGMTTIATVSERIGYWTIPVPQVRVLSFQYGGFLGNQSADNSKLIIRQLEQSLRRGEADIAVLSYVREDSPLYRVATSVRSALMRDQFLTSYPHWMLDLPNTTDEIHAAVLQEHRASLKEEARKFKKFRTAFPDLQMARFRGSDRLGELFRDAERVAATTYQRGLGVGFSDSPPIRDLLTLEAKRDWLRGYVLYADGHPCAFEIGCVYNNVFLGEYLGYDPAFAKYAPGTYILTQVIEGLCREKVAAIDWGIGDWFYKRRFSNRQWNESTIYLYAPTWRGLRVKVLRTIAVVANSTAKTVLKRVKLAERVKKLRRTRATKATSRNRAQ